MSGFSLVFNKQGVTLSFTWAFALGILAGSIVVWLYGRVFSRV